MAFDDDMTRLPDEGGAGEEQLAAGSAFGQYTILRLLGRGGMGEVYEVQHSVLRRHYALKVINREVLDRPEALERFKREGAVMNRLEHPNIVQVDEFGETDGRTWLRMPLLEGAEIAGAHCVSLSDVMNREGVLPEALIVELLKQILEGLSYAHAEGAIHRDIKPSNILIAGDGSLQLADFGLVRVAGEQWVQNQVQLTVARSMAQPNDPDKTRLPSDASGSSAGASTQAMLGTFEYMSPEQKQGREADGRSDLYAVGLIAFRMLTGQNVLGFEMPSEIRPDLDSGWDVWIKQALAPAVDRRFESAKAMLDAMPFATITEEAPEPKVERSVSDAKTTDAEQGSATPAPVRRGFPIGFVVVALLLGALGVWLYQSQTRPVNTSSGHSPASNSSTPSLATVQPTVTTVEAKPAAVSSKLSSVSSRSKVTQVPEPGRDWTVVLGGSERMKLKWIAPGSFQMGSTDGDSDEKPVHRVTLTKGYWLGEHEVTQGHWESVMGSNPSSFKGRDLPVETVRWEDAMEFCRKLTDRERAAGRLSEGYEYSLPTEAQWEYACRAGTTGAYAGDLGSMAWYDDSKTHPVGMKRANDWGLYDMHGNVWEWCSDWYGSYPSGSVVDPSGDNSGSIRVYRGGSWWITAQNCRSASRFRFDPGYRRSGLGFRLALSSIH